MDRTPERDPQSKNFEIYILMADGADRFDEESVLKELLDGGHVRPLASDPARAVYGNLSTGVFFGLTLASPLASLWESRRRSPSDEEAGEEEGFAEEEQDEPTDEEDGEDEEVADEDEDEDEEEEPAHDLEMTPVMLAVSLLSPAFFAREALAFAERIARSSDLHLDHPEPPAEGGEAAPGAEGEAPGSPVALSDFFASWNRSRRELVKRLLDGNLAGLDAAPRVDPKKPVKDDAWDGVITRWSLDKAEAWWRYGEARARLQEELENDGVRVPLLQAAKHEGRVKTLCDWDQGAPTVLPRTDLVLLRRERSQKGLFRTKRVMEEGLVSGEALWEILAGASERRREPVDILIFREAASPPQNVAAKLETLELAPLAGAKRTSLFGVIDFDPEAP